MVPFFVFLLIVAIADSKLIFVNVVHRHGDRTPEWVYPTDPYQEPFWRVGLGILTNAGKNEMYELGKFMRKRYSDFLPREYHDADLHVESSARSRTVMSAYCALTGLYEPYGKDIWSPVVENWQPVPVYTIPKLLDNKIYFKKPCPKYYQLKEKVIQTELSEERKGKFQKTLTSLSQYTGLDLNLNLKDMDMTSYIFDTLFVEESNNLKLPNWTDDFYPELLGEIGMFTYFRLPYYNKGLKRLRCGPLLKEMMQHFDEKIKGTIKEKWWQYSGHDTTVADILSCLNVYDGDRAVYASAVFVELHQNLEDKYEVAIVYRKNKDVVKELLIPNCTLYCPLEKLKELTKDVMPDDWEEECKLKGEMIYPAQKNSHGGEANTRSLIFLSLLFIFFKKMFC